MPIVPQSVTIQQVADLAEVATKTVSRVINDEPGVRADTRSRILKAIEQLDYRPNLKARGVSIDRLLVQPGNFMFADGLACAEQMLRARHPPTAIFASNDDTAAAAISVARRLGLNSPSSSRSQDSTMHPSRR